jgi:hypothetical protein
LAPGLSPSAPNRELEKLFLGWVVSLASATEGSSRAGRNENKEFWLRAELACSGLSEDLARPMSEMGEKVDFHLLLFTGSLAGVGFLPTKLPPFSKVFGGDLLSKEIVAIFLSIRVLLGSSSEPGSSSEVSGE